MNNLGNIKFISNDPYKSRREFIKKKGDRPETEWEDHIKEIEPLPLHTQEFPILFFWLQSLRNIYYSSMPKMQFDGLAALTPAIYKSEVQLVPPPLPPFSIWKFPEKIHLLQESYVCHNRHNKKIYTHDVLRKNLLIIQFWVLALNLHVPV